MKSKRYIFKRRFDGLPKTDDFELIEEELPPLETGDVLFEAVYLSMDPYMRTFQAQLPLGSTVIGSQISKVIESKDPIYSIGDFYVTNFGWVTHFVFNHNKKSEALEPLSCHPYKLPDFGDGLNLSFGLGALGMTGHIAWLGLTKICRPEKNETIVVTTAAGAVGSIVAQMSKNFGLNVIGFTGSDEKVRILKDELKLDHAFNYKTVNVRDVLRQAAPNGIDCFFDNVGGPISHEIMLQMNQYGRVAQCGAISLYNDSDDSPSLAPACQKVVVLKELHLEGFLITRWYKQWFAGAPEVIQQVREGRIIVKETIIEGFENAFDAFAGLFTGLNVGKMIVKV